MSAAISAAAASSTRRKLAQQLTVAAEGHGAVGFSLDPLATALSHLDEVVLAVVRVANRAREQLGTPRRDDDTTTHPLDDLRRLALRVGRHNHRPCDGEDAVQPARDDVAGEPRREADDVDVG